MERGQLQSKRSTGWTEPMVASAVRRWRLRVSRSRFSRATNCSSVCTGESRLWVACWRRAAIASRLARKPRLRRPSKSSSVMVVPGERVRNDIAIGDVIAELDFDGHWGLRDAAGLLAELSQGADVGDVAVDGFEHGGGEEVLA